MDDNKNDDWEINTNLFDENKILEINAENATDLLYFNKSYNITQLKNIEYFQSFNKIQKIKEKIDKLIQGNKYYIELDQKLGILTLKFKPTSNENFTIYLNENRNVMINKIFNELNKVVNNYSENRESENSNPNYIDEEESSKTINDIIPNNSIKLLQKNEITEKENITFLSVFPKGNTITGSWDGNLKIYKIFDIKKKYSEYKAHKSCVMYISIKNDNEFASCSDIEIKIFNIKEEGNKFIFEIKLFFDNAHNDVINKILYSKNNNYLFSCSMDNCIKIWDLDNNNENKKIINEDDNIFCFDFLNNEQIIISSGVYGTNIYEIIFNNNPLLVNSNKILNFKEATCLSRFGITKMYDDDTLKEFIVCGNFINIISLNENKIIFTKKFNFTIWDCCFIKDNENEELILIGNDNIVQILSKNQNKYEKGITMNEFKNKNYFRIIDMGKDVFFIFSSCNDLFSFNYSNSQNYENFDETIKIF